MAQESLNDGAVRADGTTMSDAPVTPWDAFVERFGVTAHVALVAAIASISLVIMDDPPRADAVHPLLMLLVLIALGCVAVLSYRSHDA